MLFLVGMMGTTAYGAEDQSFWKDATESSRVSVNNLMKLHQNQCSVNDELFSKLNYESPIAKNHLKEAIIGSENFCGGLDDIRTNVDSATQLEIDGKYLDAFEIYGGIINSALPLLQDIISKISNSIELANFAEAEFQKQQLSVEAEFQKQQLSDKYFKEEGSKWISDIANMKNIGQTKISQMERSLSGLEYQSDDANAELDNAWKFKREALDNYEIIKRQITEMEVLVNEGDFELLMKGMSDLTNSEINKNAGPNMERAIENVYSSIDKANSLESAYLLKQEEEKGGCLIATATYGSELAPQVQQLRELRDNHLLQTESGTSFMGMFNDFYYSFSPIVADYERENPLFKEMVKIAITPMISSLSLLNYVEMDSEVEVLGYGISLISLNVMMYVGIPASVIIGIKKKF